MGLPNNKSDIGESFEKLTNSMYERVDTGGGSILVEKSKNKEGYDGYRWAGEWFPSIEAVKNAIRGVFANISLSIVNPNGETKKLGQDYTDMYFNGQSPYNKFIEDGKQTT